MSRNRIDDVGERSGRRGKLVAGRGRAVRRERERGGGLKVVGGKGGARGGSQERLEGGFALVSRVENVSLG